MLHDRKNAVTQAESTVPTVKGRLSFFSEKLGLPDIVDRKLLTKLLKNPNIFNEFWRFFNIALFSDHTDAKWQYWLSDASSDYCG